MESDLPSPRANALRPVLLVVAGLVILGVAAGLVLRNRSAVEPASSPATATTSQPGAAIPGSAPAGTAPAGPAAAVLPKPSFDIVRINPKGDAVMAGRAAPGSKVTISDDGKAIGEAQADQNGDWVFVPSTPLAPGARTLTLQEHAANGSEANADRSVVLVVPDTAATAAAAQPGSPPPLAVLTGPGAAPTVLTGPPAADNAAGGTSLALNAAEYGEHGNLRVAGTAAPGTTVRLYVDNHPVGEAVTGPDGKWGISAPTAVAPGDHQVRVDQIGPNGIVASRVERAFTREQLAVAAGRISIAHGQNLWTIARNAYGHGISYLVIFQANRQQIRDPNLIYPGQVFALPASTAAPATPASSSKSR